MVIDELCVISRAWVNSNHRAAALAAWMSRRGSVWGMMPFDRLPVNILLVAREIAIKRFSLIA